VPDEKKTTLPATFAKMSQNLRTAATTVGSGSGSGASYLKVCDRTGALTFGANRDPVPTRHRYAVNLRSFSHGYIVFE
jgi:hypothetical protein